MHPALTPTPEPQDMPTDPGVASEPSPEPGLREAAMVPGRGMGENGTLGPEIYREDEKTQRDMETETLEEAEMCTESVPERESGVTVGVETLEREMDCSESTNTRTEVTVGEETVEGTQMCSKAGTVRECAVTVVVKTLEEPSMCSETRNVSDGELGMRVEPAEVAEMGSETETARGSGICVGVEALKGEQMCSETETLRENELCVGVDILQGEHMRSEKGIVRETQLTAGGNPTVASPEIDCRGGKGANQEECIGSVGLSRCVAQQVDPLSSEQVLMVSAIDASQVNVHKEVSVAVGEKTEETRRTVEQIPDDDSDLVEMPVDSKVTIESKGTDKEECADPVGLTKLITEQVDNLATEKGAIVTGSDASQVNIHMEECMNDGKRTDETKVITPLISQNNFEASQINRCMDIREETKIIGPLDGQNNFDASQINTGERTVETKVIAPLVSQNDFDLANMEVDLEIPLKRKGDFGVIDEKEVLRSKIEDVQAEVQFVDGATNAIGPSLLQKEAVVTEVHADHLNDVSDSGNERKEKRKDEMLEGKIPGEPRNENQMQVEIQPNALLTEETVEQDHKHNPDVLSGGEDEEKTQSSGSQRQDECLSTDREEMTDSTKNQQARRLIVKEISEKRAGEPTCNIDFKSHAEQASSEPLLEKSSAQHDLVRVPEVINRSVGEMDWERVRIPEQTSQPNTLFDSNVIRTGSVVRAEGNNEMNTTNDCQILRRESHSETNGRQEEAIVEVESGDKMFTKKESIKEVSVGSFHDMKVDRLSGVNNELHKTNTDALDTEEDAKKQSNELVLAKNEEEKGRMDDVKSTSAVHTTGKSFVAGDTIEGDRKNNSERKRKFHSNTDMQVAVQSEDLVTAKESPKVKGEEEKLSGQQICVNIVKQVKTADDVKDGEGSISSSFENHNMASSEGRVAGGKGIDGVANILGDLKHERAVVEEDKMRISVQGNIETSEKEKYVRTELEKGEMTVKAAQKRKASENHASDSGGIMNGPNQAEISVKKAKKKPVNVWAKSSTSRKGGKKNNKNGVQPNVAKEDAVFLTPVFVNQDKLEDGPDQPIALSKTDKAEKIELSENRLSASSTKGYRMVRATRGVQEGTWYFEILVEQLGPTGHTRLGWSTQKGDVQAPVGFDSNSYGYRDVDGSKVHVAIREPYGDPYLEGDVIGFYIHLPNGTEFAPKPASLVSYRGRPYLSETKDEHPKEVPGSEICFFRNGVCQGTAFKDVNGGRYFPAASMYTMPKEPSCTVKFNFGPNFQYPPDNIGTLPPPMAMCFAPYHNGMGGKESRAVPLGNDSSPVTSMQNREPHIYGTV